MRRGDRRGGTSTAAGRERRVGLRTRSAAGPLDRRAGTRSDIIQLLRARIADTLGGTGITLLAPEATSAPQPRGRDDQAAISKAAVESRADFVLILSYSAVRAPSLVRHGARHHAGYTLIWPHDTRVLGEQVFTARGSGSSEELAARMSMGEMSRVVATGMAGRIAQAIFANGRVIDPNVAATDFIVNVFIWPMRQPRTR